MKNKTLPFLVSLAISALIGISCMKAGDGVGLTSSGSVAIHIDTCLNNPKGISCPTNYCITHPTLAGCHIHIDSCTLTPKPTGCVLVDSCLTNQNLPGCKEKRCKTDSTLAECKPAVNCSTLPNVAKSVKCLDSAYFVEKVLPIFTEKCIACHVRPGGIGFIQGKLTLETSAAWDSLVNIPSFQLMDQKEITMMRVRPGLPDSSLIFLKVSKDSPPVGVQMPMTGALLTQAQIDIIKTWIIGKL